MENDSETDTGQSGNTRDLLRISSRPTLMPSLREESEDHIDEPEVTSSDKQSQVACEKPPLNSAEIAAELSEVKINNNNTPITQAVIDTKCNAAGMMNRHNGDSVSGLPIDLATKLRIQQALTGNTSPSLYEFYENNMDLSATGRHTNNHLLGVPQHFLNSTSAANTEPSTSTLDQPPQESSSTAAEQSLQSTTKDSSEASEGDKSKSPSMPPQLGQKQPSLNSSHNNNEDGINLNSSGDTKSSDRSEDGCDTKAGSQHRKVFGRFSEPDEIDARDMSIEALESKFVLLTSGFATEKQTLEKRMEQCKHNRVTSEESLKNQINSILEEIRDLIVKDSESQLKDDLENLEKRLQSVMPLTVKLASKAETEGAVKQEKKLITSSESMVEYVEHLRKLNLQESNEHQATRLRLLKAQEWGVGDGGDNSVNVNITRRCSTVGGVTQTLVGRRRASVALTALPNILAGGGMKQLSADPKSRFQHMVKKSSSSLALRRTSQESNGSDYTELPAVTVSSAPAGSDSGSSTPAVGRSPRTSLSVPEPKQEPENNNNIHTANIVDSSHVAVIKTISAVMPSVETVERPEEAQVRAPIRRRRSIKRSDTIRRSFSDASNKQPKVHKKSQLYILATQLDHHLEKFETYRMIRQKCKDLDEKYPQFRRHSNYLFMILFIFCFYVQIQF